LAQLVKTGLVILGQHTHIGGVHAAQSRVVLNTVIRIVSIADLLIGQASNSYVHGDRRNGNFLRAGAFATCMSDP
jgi:hypothetical protein